MKIIPAILTTDKKSFKEQITRLLPYFDTFQIDVQDGKFVPSTTIALPEIIESTAFLLQDTRVDMSKVKLDFHLMLIDYYRALKHIDELSGKIDVRYIFVHRNLTNISDKISAKTKSKICPTLNPSDKDLVNPERTFLDKKVINFPAIQVMTIHPGPQGQEIDYSNLDKIKSLRSLGYQGEILIDGSVNLDTAKHILTLEKNLQPNTLCVGSYLSKAEELELGNRINTLKTLVSHL
ncbi:MAG: hypothetical protein U0525_01690 [Patescibacteria group bacterium]